MQFSIEYAIPELFIMNNEDIGLFVKMMTFFTEVTVFSLGNKI